MDQIRWYSSLNGSDTKNGLRQHHEHDLLEFPEAIIIAKDKIFRSSLIKSFSLFESIEKFSEWVAERKSLSTPHMYELIGGVHQKQRLYFDLDIDSEKIEDPYSLVNSICRCIEESLISLDGFTEQKGIQIFETCYPIDLDTNQSSKYSFHLVVKGYYVDGYEQMRTFGLKVKEEITKTLGEENGACLDNIWTRVRQLRLMGSSKIDKSCSPKLFSGIWIKGRRLHKFKEICISKSMVCNVSDCVELHIPVENSSE